MNQPSLSDARIFFSSRISTEKAGRIAEQIVKNIDRVLSDDTKTLPEERDAALKQLAINVPRYEQAKAEAALTTTE